MVCFSSKRYTDRYFMLKILVLWSLRNADPINYGQDSFQSSVEINWRLPWSSTTLCKRLRNSTCPLDPMPFKLVRECSSRLPVLTQIVNGSLQTGHFPDDWKDALVFPKIIFKNLRPVSNLQFISRLTEKATFIQTNSHMTASNLYPPPTVLL